MTKWNEFSREDQLRFEGLYLQQAQQFGSEFFEVSRRVIAYLTLVNSGGVIALLTFMKGSDPIPGLSWFALSCFIFGIIAVGVVNAIAYHVHRGALFRFVRQLKPVYQGELDVEDLGKIPRQWPSYISIVFGYLAFSAMVAGCVTGVIAFLSSDNSSGLDLTWAHRFI